MQFQIYSRHEGDLRALRYDASLLMWLSGKIAAGYHNPKMLQNMKLEKEFPGLFKRDEAAQQVDFLNGVLEFNKRFDN